MQTVLPLDNGDSVKLTTARYYTPSGRSIQALGINPDIIVQQPQPAPTDEDDAEFQQSSEGEMIALGVGITAAVLAAAAGGVYWAVQ